MPVIAFYHQTNLLPGRLARVTGLPLADARLAPGGQVLRRLVVGLN